MLVLKALINPAVFDKIKGGHSVVSVRILSPYDSVVGWKYFQIPVSFQSYQRQHSNVQSNTVQEWLTLVPADSSIVVVHVESENGRDRMCPQVSLGLANKIQYPNLVQLDRSHCPRTVRLHRSHCRWWRRHVPAFHWWKPPVGWAHPHLSLLAGNFVLLQHNHVALELAGLLSRNNNNRRNWNWRKQTVFTVHPCAGL